jgi:predicted nucleotidyltransferase
MKAQDFGIKDKFWDKLIGVFKKYDKICKVIIYGSRAKGTYQKGSDIDLVIIGPELSFE